KRDAEAAITESGRSPEVRGVDDGRARSVQFCNEDVRLPVKRCLKRAGRRRKVCGAGFARDVRIAARIYGDRESGVGRGAAKKSRILKDGINDEFTIAIVGTEAKANFAG